MAADGAQTTYSFDPAASTFGRGQTAYFWEFGRRLVALVQTAPGELILDVAAGTGAVSVPLADAGVRVMAADVSLPMLSQLEVGTRRIARLGGSALALPFPDHTFDVVTCGFGVAFFPDLSVALCEMRRVLRPNGRIGFTWWLYEERTPWVAAFELSNPLLAADVARTWERAQELANPSLLTTLAVEAGFTECAAHRLEVPWGGATFDEFFERCLRGWRGRGLDEAGVSGLREGLTAVAARYMDASGHLRYPLHGVAVTGISPQ